MQAEEVYRFLQHTPFQPVRVHLRDGRSYDIRMRALAVVGTTYLDIGIPLPGETKPIAEHIVTVDLEDVTDLERLQKAGTSPLA